jgi:uncharacterized protein (TIGR04562 family)
MDRPSYLSKYMFDWDALEVVVGGKSALDSKNFIVPMSSAEEVNQFLRGYGLDPSDPVTNAELFGNFHEAVQFIRRYFLKEGSPDGLEYQVPNSLLMIGDITQLFILAADETNSKNREEQLWAEIVLKVMHTIVHTDKDLRSNYFNIVQTQIFDRYYKYAFRNDEDKLFFGDKGTENVISLVDFETKSKKTRESIIIKLLHKAENVAEELFDRIGVRFVTTTRFDTIRLVRFLLEKNIIVPHNNKPSRSINTMIDLKKFRESHQQILKMAIRNNLSEDRFVAAMEREIWQCKFIGKDSEHNKFTSKNYQSIQFTCRQLIEYKNPFLHEFNELRRLAKNSAPESNELAKKILNLDHSLVARDIRFFYPYEIQVVDIEAFKENTEGEASHQEYKRQQVLSAQKRLFKKLINYKTHNAKH